MGRERNSRSWQQKDEGEEGEEATAEEQAAEEEEECFTRGDGISVSASVIIRTWLKARPTVQ